MNKDETADLVEALQKGQVTVTFQKVNSDEIRVMPCTLNPTVLEANEVSLGKESELTSVIPVWSTDQNAWRSFRTDSIISWEVLGE